MNYKTITRSAIVVLLAVSCAKEKPFDKVEKTADLNFASAHQSKQLLLDMCTLEDPCVYAPSVINTPKEVPASRPYWQGEQKLVVSHITDSEIQFLEMEKDARFQDNINNLSPVLNLSVEHIDYKCAEDEFGDCTNSEEVDSDKHWSKRRFVKIQNIDVVEVNTLPIQFSELFQQGCFVETNQEVTKLAIENNAINIKVKKTYSANVQCMEAIESEEDLRYLNFSVDYAYSIVKLSQLADKNYETIKYPKSDEDYFGFFKTENKGTTVDNHDHVIGVRENYLNRWSPARKEITYYLNSAFERPEMKVIKEATYSAIESVNKSLETANAGIRIKLEKGDDSKIGDIRESFIILERDPQASGVIGYGPSVKNPKTGEILSARTVMYYGTIQKFVSRAYDDLVDETLAGPVVRDHAVTAGEIAIAKNEHNGFSLNSESLSVDNYVLGDISAKIVEANRFINQFSRKDEFRSLLHDSDKKIDLYDLYSKHLKGYQTQEALIASLAKETFYHGSNINFDGAVLDALANQIAKGEKPKHWIDLTEAQRAVIMEQLVPYVWVPTLVHEFGHNLGLRHNFYGSTDKENYYSSEERRALGMRKDVTYSSIMDYSFKANNELFVMGKYDIAALRFGYAREVEVLEKDDKDNAVFQKIKNTISETKFPVAVKTYKYCSDEHVGGNPLCNRFDDGSTFEEVADHYISQYKDNYDKVNFRGRRFSFDGGMGDVGYLNYLFGSFISVRQFFDIFDQSAFNGDFNGEEWMKNPRLVDIKKASDKSFDFFLDIIETPAYHCIVIDKKTGQAVQISPFAELIGRTFDIAKGCDYLNKQYEAGGQYMFAEFGKYFNNTIDIDLDRSVTESGNTQIDVRGSWMDKIVATMITSLRMSSAQTIGLPSAGNYLDYPFYKERMLKTIDGVLKNQMTKVVDVTFPDGKVIQAEMNYSLDSTHEIYKSYHPGVNYFVGINENSSTSFKKAFFSFLKKKLINEQDEGNIDSEDIMDTYLSFDVDRVSTKADLERYNYDRVLEFKSPSGKVNYRFGLYDYNTKALELAVIYDDISFFKNLDQKLVIAGYRLLADPAVTIETLKAGGEYTEEELASIIKVSEKQLDNIYGFLTETLNEEVILTSLLALSK